MKQHLNLLRKLIWNPVPGEFPAGDEMVMIHTPDEPTPVWIGWYDGEVWRCAEGGEVRVTAWQPIPSSPTDSFPSTP